MKKILLEVHKDNNIALKFYKKNGFEIIDKQNMNIKESLFLEKMIND